MIEQRLFPFGGVPVYNPQSLSKEEALAQFHVRQPAYEHLMALLGQERSPHVLIIGTRGMGKTTLLQRVRYGVEDERELDLRYLVLVFPEEQYNVNRLDRFLLNTVDAVADSVERLHDKQTLSRVESYADSLARRSAEEIEEDVPQFLAKLGREMHKDFLLLVDNADRLFEMIDEKQQWKLRELLSSRRDLTLFGATTQASEGIYGSDRAFFEFFQIQTLPPLTQSEVRSLLLRLSESVGEKEGEKGTAKRRVTEWLDADEARLRTLVQLTGGNPRTAVLLFHLVLDGLQGGAREYLEQLLDQVTPTYKGRVDELSPQAQQVLDAVALHWDPVTAMEVAAESGLETGIVSTQLTRLVRQGILEKADPGDSKKALYQVAERFFNIWYLMRASRRVRAKLRWFVEFLRVFFDNAQLEVIAWDRIERFRPTWRKDPMEAETAIAYLIAARSPRSRCEEYFKRNCSDSEEIWGPYLDLMEGGAAQHAGRPDERFDRTEMEIRHLIESDPGNAAYLVRLGKFLGREPDRAAEAESTFRNAIRIDPKSAPAWSGLSLLLSRDASRQEEAESCARRAIELDPDDAQSWCDLGLVLFRSAERLFEAEIAFRKAVELDPKSGGGWQGLGYVLDRQGSTAEAEAAIRMAIELDPQWSPSWWSLGKLLAHDHRTAEAEVAYTKAIELDPTSAKAWCLLGGLLEAIPSRSADAEVACRKAINLDGSQPFYWWALGRLLDSKPDRTAEAEHAYRKAIELDHEYEIAWFGLGKLLSKTRGRDEEAEAAYRKAVELSGSEPAFWNGLGQLLSSKPERNAEAEHAYRKAIELDGSKPRYWMDLGMLLLQSPNPASEAAGAFRRAIALDPQSACAWWGLGWSLAETPARAGEAEAAYREAIRLGPNVGVFFFSLGVLLERTPERFADAEAALRRATELDPRIAASSLGDLLARKPERLSEAEALYRKAIELDPEAASTWAALGFFLASRADKPREAQAAFRQAILLEPANVEPIRNLGALLVCDLDDPQGGSDQFDLAHQLDPTNPITSAMATAARRAVGKPSVGEFPLNASRGADFWNELLVFCGNYPPFGKLLVSICDLVQELHPVNRFAKLHRAVAFGQLGEFPRASVAFEDALVGDPIELLAIGQKAIELLLEASVRNGRVRDFIEVLDKKEWKDAWRPIYEALRAVDAGSAEYLKRIAAEIRTPALDLLRRIAPDLRDMPDGAR